MAGVIEQTIECNYSTVRAQARRKGRKGEGALEIHKEAVVWYGTLPFLTRDHDTDETVSGSVITLSIIS